MSSADPSPVPAPPGVLGRHAVHRGGQWQRRLLIGVGLAFFSLLVIVPVANVFVQAFSEGIGPFWEGVSSSESVSAMWLTFKVVAIVTPITCIFGLAAAWMLSRDTLRGSMFISGFIDVPWAVSPVIAGMLVMFVYSPTIGILAEWVDKLGVQIIFALPGLVLATLFLTLPMVVRELVPVWTNLDRNEEDAAMLLGANRWQTFRRVVFPALRWPLFYGVVLTIAKVVGEYGAASVVSGKIIGQTNTMALHIERCYLEYQTVPAFASASILTALSLLVVVVQLILTRLSPTQPH